MAGEAIETCEPKLVSDGRRESSSNNVNEVYRMKMLGN